MAKTSVSYRFGFPGLLLLFCLLPVAIAVTFMAVSCSNGADTGSSSITPVGSTDGSPEGQSDSTTRVPATAYFGDPTATAPASGNSEYAGWAQAVCTVLDSSVLLPETISVGPGDLETFFRSAASNSQRVASELGDIDAAPGTAAFMQTVVRTFEALSPVLSDTADQLASTSGTPGSSGSVDLGSLQALLGPRESTINQKLGEIRDAYQALPADAARAIAAVGSCGVLRRARRRAKHFQQAPLRPACS